MWDPEWRVMSSGEDADGSGSLAAGSPVSLLDSILGLPECKATLRAAGHSHSEVRERRTRLVTANRHHKSADRENGGLLGRHHRQAGGSGV